MDPAVCIAGVYSVRMLALASWVGLFLAGPVGCGAERAGPAGSADTGARDGGGDLCHFDCLFNAHECAGGVVTTFIAQPVPCAQWRGACPSAVTHTCALGCRTDGVVISGTIFDRAHPEAACDDGLGKHPGDPCSSDADCRPARTVFHGDGTVTNLYIRCDVAAQRCVEHAPPSPADYLGPCDVDLTGVPVGAFGFVDSATTTCAGGLCLIAPNGNCHGMACTLPCTDHTDCPQGSTCAPQFNWTPGATSVPRMMCRPGADSVSLERRLMCR